jgi:hypothetical protein
MRFDTYESGVLEGYIVAEMRITSIKNDYEALEISVFTLRGGRD